MSAFDRLLTSVRLVKIAERTVVGARRLGRGGDGGGGKIEWGVGTLATPEAGGG